MYVDEHAVDVEDDDFGEFSFHASFFLEFIIDNLHTTDAPD